MSNHHRTRPHSAQRRKLPPFGERITFWLLAGEDSRWLYGTREMGGAETYHWVCSETDNSYTAAQVTHWRAAPTPPPEVWVPAREPRRRLPAPPKVAARIRLRYGAAAYGMSADRVAAAREEISA